ncbi:MAG: DUF3592 domain-containing protein [Cyanobacteria bacterium P01_F01_bin.53]
MKTIEHDLKELIGTLFPVIGAGLLLIAVVSTAFTYRFINMASRAEGKVVKLNAGGAHPVIRFVPVGEEEEVEFSGSGFINYSVDDKVSVLYLKDAQNPSGFQTNIDTPGALWAAPLGFTWIGMGFVIGGLYTKHLYKP